MLRKKKWSQISGDRQEYQSKDGCPGTFRCNHHLHSAKATFCISHQKFELVTVEQRPLLLENSKGSMLTTTRLATNKPIIEV